MRRKMSIALALVLGLSLTACAGQGNSPVNNNDPGNGSEPVVDDSNQDDNSGQDTTGGDTDDGSNPSADTSGEGGENSPTETDWKKVYLDFFENKLDSVSEVLDGYDGWSCGFINVNGDEIPEMIITSGYEAAGSFVVTVVDGEANWFRTNRLGIDYVPGENVLSNSDGIMGYYYDTVYSITDKGFEVVAQGRYADEYGDEGYTGLQHFFWDDVETDEDTYFAKLKEYLPVDKKLHFGSGTSFDAVKAYLAGNGPKDYKEAYTGLLDSGFGAYAGESYPAFALIERNGKDPILIGSDSNHFSIASFDDGLLSVSTSQYVGSDRITVIYPNLVSFETMTASETYSYDGFCRLETGSLVSQDRVSYPLTDENGEPLPESEDGSSYVYEINNVKVTENEYYSLLDEYFESFKIEYTPYDADTTYIDYVSSDALRDMLK